MTTIELTPSRSRSLTISSSTVVDVIGSSLNNVVGGGRYGLRIDGSSNVRVGEGTVVNDNSNEHRRLQ